MRATVRDVAREARVSPKTVSNVLNGAFPVSSETRRRVEVAMSKLQYVPNLSARALRNGRSGQIALALPDIGTPYSADITRAFVKAATKRHLALQIEESSGSPEREAQLISRARAQLVDGLVLNSVLLETSTVQPGVSLPPVIMIGEVESPAIDHLWVDNVAAVREITWTLIAEGHRQILLLGAMPSVSYRLRSQGFREALVAAGLPATASLEVEVAAWTAEAAAAAVHQYLAHRPLPDALVCCTDTLAMGALSALWAEGYRVPDDLSVVGYDDIPDAAFTVPPLTTVRFDRSLLAETALDLLARRLADPLQPRTIITLPHEVVRRRSSRSR